MRNCRGALLLAPIMLLSAGHALAAWQPGGNLLGRGIGFRVAASGPDRVIVAWIGLSSGGQEVRAQAWTADGDIAAGWPRDGVRVASGSTQDFGSIDLAADGAGGAFVAWVDRDLAAVRVQKLSASGSPATGWAPQGVDLGPGFIDGLASDGEGGVLAARHIVSPLRQSQGLSLHRIDNFGVLAAGWPVEGLRLPGGSRAGLMVDGDHHVLVSTAEVYRSTYRPIGIVVRRLNRNGVPDPSWPEPGVVLSESRYASDTRLLPDGEGGVFAAWYVNQDCSYFCPYYAGQSVARVSSDGSTHGGWNPALRGTSIAPDGAGGMLVGLQKDGRPSVLRLSADGAEMPGWDAGGSPAMTEIVKSTRVVVCADQRGGAYVAWWDLRSGEYHVYASRLDASGGLAEDWPRTGSVIGPRGHSKYMETSLSVSLASLGSEGAVAVWTEYPGPRGYIAALRPDKPGPIAELAPIDYPVGFGVVDVRPNPARGTIAATVELPGAGPARLDLIDAAGRRVESREFSFAQPARGSVRFNAAGRFSAGIYWLRLTQGDRVASKRVVVLE